MITYHKVKKEELRQCIDLIVDSFSGYPFYEVFVKNKNRRLKFLKSIQEVSVKISYKKELILVGLKDNKIISVAQLKAPEDSDSSIMR